jgi:hypothetical protein
VLPVRLQPGDDRVETPDGGRPRVIMPDHPVVKGLQPSWPRVLGYNALLARENGQVLVSCDDHPFVAVREVGKGRTLAFATDCGPHWAPQWFVEWDGYETLWAQSMAWLTRSPEPSSERTATRSAELDRMYSGLKAAQSKTKASMAELRQAIRTGMSETEVAALADRITRSAGSSGPWCPILVAFGEGTQHADPAHPPSDRRLGHDDIVMIDLTPVFDGFYGDYSESFTWEGERYRALVEAAREVEQETIKAAGDCSSPDELFGFARDAIEVRGLDLLDPLVNIGHSVGQMAFLEGFVEPGNVRPLQGGWTVEPFVGHGQAGAKFEDILFFRDGTAEVL